MAPHPFDLETLRTERAVLCLRFLDRDGVLEAARAAVRGGLRILEITLTTPGALDLIAALRNDTPWVGAGTVLTVADAHRVADAGGTFALSPVFDPDVFEAGRSRGLWMLPGAATPSEIFRAHQHGASAVKVFPADALGGPSFIRAVRGPLPHIPLVPTRGPDSENFHDYFDAGATAVGVGSEVFADGLDPRGVQTRAAHVRKALDQASADGTPSN